MYTWALRSKAIWILIMSLTLGLMCTSTAWATNKMVLKVETFIDGGCTQPSTSFVAGEPIWVKVSLEGHARVSATGLESLESRVYYSTQLGAASNRTKGPIVGPGLAYNSAYVAESVSLKPGFHGVSFNVYNQYLNSVAAPLVQDGWLLSFRIDGKQSTLPGAYMIGFSDVPGQTSLVTYNGATASPQISNKVPTTSYIAFESALITIVAPPANPPVPPAPPTPPIPSDPDPDPTPATNPQPEVPTEEQPAAPVEPQPQVQPLRTIVGTRGYSLGESNTDMVACYYKGRDTMMPIRMLEVFGVVLDWDEDTKTAVLTYKGNVVKLTIGSPDAYINGVKTPIVGASGELVPPELAPGRTMIPLRFVSEKLGFTVTWDPSNEVTITP